MNHEMLVKDGSLIHCLSKNLHIYIYIYWVVPLPSNSDHQDYYIFSRESLSKNLHMCHGQGCRVFLGMGKIPPFNDGILIMGPYKPLRTWVGDHPLLYGNNGSLDPIYMPGKFH